MQIYRTPRLWQSPEAAALEEENDEQGLLRKGCYVQSYISALDEIEGLVATVEANDKFLKSIN